MLLKITEHQSSVVYPYSISLQDVQSFELEHEAYQRIVPRTFHSKRGNARACFLLRRDQQLLQVDANYYIGLDWLIEGKHALQVLPKINIKLIDEVNRSLGEEDPSAEDYGAEAKKGEPVLKEVDYLKMFLDAMAHPIIARETEGLLFIDWQQKPIEIEQQQDALTPFLIIQFLNLLKQIVKKGLKKSYYKQREHLNNRVKGKLLIPSHIRQNVLKNRFGKVHCEFQEFGINNLENQFLKKVLKFVNCYIAEHQRAFGSSRASLEQMISQCNPAFELISSELRQEQLRHIRTNPFFSEYKEAIKIGDLILKRFSYNITNTSLKRIKTPPFWIDMPRLFELYAYHHLLTVFGPAEVKYHYKTYGNELDFLIKSEQLKMVVDAKYKLHYHSGAVHQDIRQVSGYARLKKVYRELGLEDSNELIDCLIIYPDTLPLSADYRLILENQVQIEPYQNVYKIGLPLPWISEQSYTQYESNHQTPWPH